MIAMAEEASRIGDALVAGLGDEQIALLNKSIE